MAPDAKLEVSRRRLLVGGTLPAAGAGLPLAGLAAAEEAPAVVYPGAPHGITDTHKEALNRDLLVFLRA